MAPSTSRVMSKSDNLGFGRRDDIFAGHTGGHFLNVQPAMGHIQYAKVGNDAIDLLLTEL